MSTATKIPEIKVGGYGIDRAHSTATFEVEHAGISAYRGGFDKVNARLEVTGEGLVITGEADVESISIDDENIRPHLLSPEFFDAERNPQIRFRSTELELDGDALKVRGDLELAGVSREVAATGRVKGPIELGETTKLAVALETTIDRTEFGMDWQMDLPDGSKALGDEVRIAVELELASG